MPAVRISRLQGGETHVGADERRRRILGDGALLDQAAVALGGLAAERVLLGEASSGSASDTARATELVAHRLDGGGPASRAPDASVRRGAHERDGAHGAGDPTGTSTASGHGSSAA